MTGCSASFGVTVATVVLATTTKVARREVNETMLKEIWR